MIETAARPTEVVVAPLAPRSLAQVTLAFTLGGLAVLAIWFTGYVLVIGAAQEQGDQQRAFATFRSELSQATAPLGPTQEGRPVAMIQGPGLHRAVVLEGATSQDLQSGPGHRRDTVLPGQVGVSVLYGKGATFGAPFKHISAMRIGDAMQVTTGQGSFTYLVTGVRHGGDLAPLPPTGTQSRLTLVSTAGSGWRSGWAPTDAVYVDALLDKGVPGTTRRIAPIAAEAVLASSDDALLPLVLWLEALLLVIGGGVWAWARWGRWQSWLVASPALVAVLVATSKAADQLLPNLM